MLAEGGVSKGAVEDKAVKDNQARPKCLNNKRLQRPVDYFSIQDRLRLLNGIHRVL